MMGGPIDTRESPTTVNDLAMDRPIAWFRETVIATVPFAYKGAGRRVYPGFLQLASFMSMNLGAHIQSHYELYKHLNDADDVDAQLSAQATKDFYDEYRSVCDMTAEFYLQTVEEVFQKHSIPNNEFTHHGRAGRSQRHHRHRHPRDRGGARRYFRTRSDQGRAETDAQSGGRQETLLHGGEGGPLRHLQRQQMARQGGTGGRGIHRRAWVRRVAANEVESGHCSVASTCSIFCRNPCIPAKGT